MIVYLWFFCLSPYLTLFTRAVLIKGTEKPPPFEPAIKSQPKKSTLTGFTKIWLVNKTEKK